MLNPENFFNKDSDIYRGLFKDARYVWDGLKYISAYVKENIKPNIADVPRNGLLVTQTAELQNGAVIHSGAYLDGDGIEIGPGAVIEPAAYIRGPAIIGPNTEVRQAAYIRGNVVTGDSCVVGHATEMKNSAMLGNSPGISLPRAKLTHLPRHQTRWYAESAGNWGIRRTSLSSTMKLITATAVVLAVRMLSWLVTNERKLRSVKRKPVSGSPDWRQ